MSLSISPGFDFTYYEYEAIQRKFLFVVRRGGRDIRALHAGILSYIEPAGRGHYASKGSTAVSRISAPAVICLDSFLQNRAASPFPPSST